LTLAQTQGWPE